MAKEPKKAENKKTSDTKKKTVKKVSKKAVKNTAPKEGYLKGVRKEMKLVKWPTWNEVIKNTVATLVLCIVICGFFLLLNLLLSLVKGWIQL